METITVNEADVVTTQGGEISTEHPQGISVVHVAIPNQPVQVQSVIQPTSQASVIQTAGAQTITVTDEGEIVEDPDGKKRREILARRPSYRKILNDLSSDSPLSGMAKIEEESNSSQEGQDAQEVNNLSTSHNATATTVATVQYQQAAGATIVQYAQGPDGQFFIPATNVQAYQIAAPTSLPQGVVMATSTLTNSPQNLSEEASRKRELRLLKNREAARECRRKKKDYVRCLENRVAILENQNKALIEELRTLKELYCQKDVMEEEPH